MSRVRRRRVQWSVQALPGGLTPDRATDGRTVSLEPREIAARRLIAQLLAPSDAHPLAGRVLAPVDVCRWMLAIQGQNYDGGLEAIAIRQGRRRSRFRTAPAEAELDAPVRINVAGVEGTRAQHLVIRAGAFSKATVILSHSGSAQAALNQTVEVETGDSANLTVVSLQEWDDTVLHASNQRLALGRDSKLTHIVVTFGGDLVRLCADTDFRGPGAELTMLGIYFVDGGQHLEHRVFVDHSQPNCYSRVTYKGALQGKDAHSVWIGDCLIREAADATDTYELNRNLVLTEGAKADSVPNLEIENGEIKGAGHASATGRFDDEQLFYLMSRGVAEVEARRLVVRGFFAELINQIGVPEVVDHLMATVEAELAKSRTN